MSGNRVEGAARKAAGAVKEGVGRVTGDRKMEAEGAAEKTGGSVQNKSAKLRTRSAGRSSGRTRGGRLGARHVRRRSPSDKRTGPARSRPSPSRLERLGDQKGRFRPVSGQQVFRKGGDEDHRHIEAEPGCPRTASMPMRHPPAGCRPAPGPDVRTAWLAASSRVAAMPTTSWPSSLDEGFQVRGDDRFVLDDQHRRWRVRRRCLSGPRR